MSLKQLSELTGFSKSTVSRVINAHPYVSPEAVQRVQNVIAELNYRHRPRRVRRKNQTASEGALKKKALTAFALVVTDIRSSSYSSLIHGFDKVAGEVGHQVITCNSADDVYRQADIVLRLLDKGVAGVALNPAAGLPAPLYQMRRLHASGIPVVFLHRGICGFKAPLIRLPYDQVAAMAAEQMVARGHRRIALFLLSRAEGKAIYETELRKALDEYAVGSPGRLTVHYGSSAAGDWEEYEGDVEGALKELLEMPVEDRPTAIFTPWEPTAKLIYLRLTKWGYDVPADISVVTEGDSFRGDALSRQLTGVTLDESQAGGLAARLLDEMCQGARSLQDQQQFTIQIGWHEGQTLGGGVG